MENKSEKFPQQEAKDDDLISELGLKDVLKDNFPEIQFAFGYGSGVFRQIGYDYSKTQPMIDLMFGVEDADEWHSFNLKRNPSHYSGLGYYFGSSYLHKLQQNITPVHFNPSIQIQNKNRSLNIKYGVVDIKRLQKDLVRWDIITCSGRLHKPVKILLLDELNSKQIKNDLDVNLIQATAISLLLNFSPYIDMKQFLTTVTSLSYIGDIRFAFGAENKNKISNLVEGNYYNFNSLYSNIIQNKSPLNTFAEIVTSSQNQHIKLNCNEQTVFDLVNVLPQGLGLFARSNEIVVKTINLQEIQRSLIERIQKINLAQSQRLILYNMLATSPSKNIFYVLQKLKKGILKK